MKTKIHYPKGFPCTPRFVLIILMISVACFFYKVFGSEPEKKARTTSMVFIDYPAADAIPALEPWMLDLSLFCLPGELSVWLAEKEEEASCSQLESWMFDFSLDERDPKDSLEYWMLDPAAFMKNLPEYAVSRKGAK